MLPPFPPAILVARDACPEFRLLIELQLIEVPFEVSTVSAPPIERNEVDVAVD